MSKYFYIGLADFGTMFIIRLFGITLYKKETNWREKAKRNVWGQAGEDIKAGDAVVLKNGRFFRATSND